MNGGNIASSGKGVYSSIDGNKSYEYSDDGVVRYCNFVMKSGSITAVNYGVSHETFWGSGNPCKYVLTGGTVESSGSYALYLASAEDGVYIGDKIVLNGGGTCSDICAYGYLNVVSGLENGFSIRPGTDPSANSDKTIIVGAADPTVSGSTTFTLTEALKNKVTLEVIDSGKAPFVSMYLDTDDNAIKSTISTFAVDTSYSHDGVADMTVEGGDANSDGICEDLNGYLYVPIAKDGSGIVVYREATLKDAAQGLYLDGEQWLYDPVYWQKDAASGLFVSVHVHSVYNETEDKYEYTVFKTALSSASYPAEEALYLASGSYYLAEDMSNEFYLAENAEVTLCLNNHTAAYINTTFGKSLEVFADKCGGIVGQITAIDEDTVIDLYSVKVTGAVYLWPATLNLHDSEVKSIADITSGMLTIDGTSSVETITGSGSGEATGTITVKAGTVNSIRVFSKETVNLQGGSVTSVSAESNFSGTITIGKDVDVETLSVDAWWNPEKAANYIVMGDITNGITVTAETKSGKITLKDAPVIGGTLQFSENCTYVIGSGMTGKTYAVSYVGTLEQGDKKLFATPGDGVTLRAETVEMFTISQTACEIVYDAEDGSLYLVVHAYIADQDGDGKPEVDTDDDGIYEGSKGDTTYIPDQDGDGKPEPDTNGDNVYEGTDTTDEDGDGHKNETYIPDQDGDGKPEPDTNGDGVYEGTDKTDEDGDGHKNETYIPDQDGDGKPEPDTDDDGVYEGTDKTDEDGDGNKNEFYIPDQDGDKKPEPESDIPGIFDGTDSDKDEEYVIDPDRDTDDDGSDDNDKYVKVDDDDSDGIYDEVDGGTNGDKYVPDQNGDHIAEKVTGPDENGAYEDGDGNKYIPDQDGDGKPEPDTDGDGKYEGTSDDKKYVSDGNGGWKEYVPYYPTPSVPDKDETCSGGKNCPSRAFTDLSAAMDKNPDIWYHEAIDYALNNKLMNGIGNNLFDPDGNLSRAMMVQVLYNMEGRPAYTTDKSFDDVASGQWYYDAVLWAAENDIVNGYPGNVYGPNDSITREQMAAILYRYAQFKGINVSAQGDLSKFTDGDTVSSWAVEEMQWAVKVGLMQGYNNMLEPIDTATRAEVAQIFMNYCTKILKK